jgi:hypothetical protein
MQIKDLSLHMGYCPPAWDKGERVVRVQGRDRDRETRKVKRDKRGSEDLDSPKCYK